MAKAKTTPKKSAPRAATRTRSKPAASPEAAPLTTEAPRTPEQETIASAKTATSDITAGGAETVPESAIRMESEGVLTPIKSDFDNPESPVIGDPAGALVSPALPGKVTVGPGETAAQHEAHVLTSSPAMIAERIELEQGPDGLPTDVIAAAQQARVVKTDFQRIAPATDEDPGTVIAGSNDGTKRAGFPPAAGDVPLDK
jgi:hypothetical protein